MFILFSTYICWINTQNATLEVSGAVRRLYWSLGVKGLNHVKSDAQADSFRTQLCGDATRFLDKDVAWRLLDAVQ